MDTFRPDWTKRWTASQAEKELHNFRFKGPGWYTLGEDNHMIVIPLDRNTHHWASKFSATEIFEFNVYNGRRPADTFNLIINAPTRE